jgi:quercetin dioxygenase-like cupin family protein
MKLNLFDQAALKWHHYTEADSSFPISYWGAILDIDDAGHLTLLYRWDPGAYCHFHRHTCETASLVLEGELHVTAFEDGEPSDTYVRVKGDYAKKPPGDVHMERGGDDGALVLFQLYAPDGGLTEQLDSHGEVCRAMTRDQMHAFWEKQRAA